MLVVCYYYGLSVLRMYSYCDIIRSKVKKKRCICFSGHSSQLSYCLVSMTLTLFQLNIISGKSKCALNVQCCLNIVKLISAENYTNISNKESFFEYNEVNKYGVIKFIIMPRPYLITL